MNTNTSTIQQLLYPELSYEITGILFSAHNDLGRYAREKQYGDLLESKFKENALAYEREYRIGDSGNIVDFLVDGKILLELKAKRLITKENYYQTQRYLQETGISLGLLINFRNEYLVPRRVVRIDKQ
jgi:GxxExxY protein